MENKENSSISVIAYFGPVGLLIAYIMYDKNKTDFNRFHIRQSFGANLFLILAYIAANIASNFIYFLGAYFISQVMFIAVYAVALFVMVTGIINVSKGKTEYLPIAGKKFEEIAEKVIK